VASNATLGLAGSWSTTDVSFDTIGDDATVDTYQGALYGSVGMGRFYLDGSATYSSHDLSVTRLVDLPGPATPFEASSNYNASAWSLNGEFGSIFRLGRVDLQPSAGLSYTSLSTDGFTETGDNDAFNLLVQGSDANSFASTLAVRGSGQFMMGRTRVMPDLKLGWRHDFGDDRQTFTAAFEEDPTTFDIISSKTASDAAIVNAGITAAVTKNLEVFVDLNGQYSGEVTTSNAAGGMRFTW
jgi:outer membrane autotransporter protein